MLDASIRQAQQTDALFAGSDGGGKHLTIIANLIETCKLRDIEPQMYRRDHHLDRMVIPTAGLSHCPTLKHVA